METKKSYTKTGDSGLTKDFAGNTLSKDDPKIILLGKIDSLQSAIDLLILNAPQKYSQVLEEIQKKLWQAAGEIANCSSDCIPWPITSQDIQKIEHFADSLGSPPQKFVRFNTLLSVQANEARIRARDLETHAVKFLRSGSLRPEIFQYFNRLSSLFFMLAYSETKH